MPRGDGTGPMGMGLMTGRGAGYCNGFTIPGCATPAGFAGGYGLGRGRGFRNRKIFYAAGATEWAQYGNPLFTRHNEAAFDEKEILNSQAEFLENRLQQVKKRLAGLNEETE